MSIVPQGNPSLEIGWGDAGATAMAPGEYVWAILQTDSGYTYVLCCLSQVYKNSKFLCSSIRDGVETQNWHIDNAATGANVGVSSMLPENALNGCNRSPSVLIKGLRDIVGFLRVLEPSAYISLHKACVQCPTTRTSF